jgi:hypothetical protein
MRIRNVSSSGDYTFGNGSANFLIDSPAAVGLLVQDRLLLFQGSWFLDQTDGVPYSSEVLGTNTKSLYDLVIQNRVLATPNVTGIENYESNLSPGRQLTVSFNIDTAFGGLEPAISFIITPSGVIILTSEGGSSLVSESGGLLVQ